MQPARITLMVAHGGLEGKEYIFEEHARCIVGRAPDCDILMPMDITHADVSRHHCAFEIDPPAIRVRDLGSRNGTYVNGENIGQRSPHQMAEDADVSESEAHDLQDGNEIQVGHTVFRIGIAVASDIPKEMSVPSFFC